MCTIIKVKVLYLKQHLNNHYMHKVNLQWDER